MMDLNTESIDDRVGASMMLMRAEEISRCCKNETERRNIRRLKKRRQSPKEAQEIHKEQAPMSLPYCNTNIKLSHILTIALLLIYLNLHTLNIFISAETTPEFVPSQTISDLTSVATPPSQLFLPPANQQAQPISLVGGFHPKKSDEEEDGFIMQAASATVPQNESTSLQVPAESSGSAIGTESSMSVTEQQPTMGSDETSQEQTTSDQMIPIDVNRQQFVTHDQLSLLNASTKDENINLSNGSDDQTVGPTLSVSGMDPIQKVQSSRAGMSKVSHVSSFLSDLFAYATRPRQPTLANEDSEQQQVATGGQRAANAPAKQHQPTTTNSPPQTQPATCPGICRSILTASILCRNEINAPCPSFLQKCCEKDDVSFNGTPVQTSAPLSTGDTDSNSPPLSDNLSQTQEQSTVDYQATVPSTLAPPATSASFTSLNNAVWPTAVEKAAIIGPGRNGTIKSWPTESAATTTSAIDLLFASASDQPGSIYFLSSSNGSSDDGDRSRSDQSVDRNEPSKQQQQQQQQQQQVDNVAQSANDEQAARFKHPASQSFDSPLDGTSSKSGLDRKAEINPTTGEQTLINKSNQIVVVHTANGTILYQPAGERPRRPTYANWTDYHLSMMQSRGPNGGQSVVYHSNIDPVKSFAESHSRVNESSTTTRQQNQATTMQNLDLINSVASTPASSQSPLSTTLPAVNPSKEQSLCTGVCMPLIHKRFCQAPAASSQYQRCENENNFCCNQSSDQVNSYIKKTLAIPKDPLVQSTRDSLSTESAGKRSTSVDDKSEPDIQALKVMNDQHSGSASSKSRIGPTTTTSGSSTTNQSPQQTTAPTLTTTTTTTNRQQAQQAAGDRPRQTTASSDQSTTPKVLSVVSQSSSQLAENSGDQQVTSTDNQPIGSVGNVLVELLDSWITGGSTTSGQSSSSSPSTSSQASSSHEDQRQPAQQSTTLDTHATDQMASFASPDHPVSEQHNDRRLGFDLSFRQHQHPDQSASNSSQSQQSDLLNQQASEFGLTTANENGGGVEQVESTGNNVQQQQGQQSKCVGYCTLPLFTMLCDSTYRSADCGPSQKCCVIGRPSNTQLDEQDSPANSQLSSVDQQLAAGGNRQQMAQATCRGSCLPVYHSSLCTKPNEIQLDSPGCLPNFVCCNQPQSVQDGGSNHIEDLETLLPASSVDSSATQPQLMGTTSESQLNLKDNSLFAALLPPPPPVLPNMNNQDKQLIQEKQNNLNENQFLATSSRQRQNSISPNMIPQDLLFQQQLYQPHQQPTVRPSNSKTALGSSHGIMSQLYQMFKSNSPGKQRNRPQQQPQQQQQQHPNQQVNFMAQMYDPYQLQAASTGIRQTNMAPPPQPPQQTPQIMFPISQQPPHNVLLSQGHFAAANPNTGYPVDASGMVDVRQQQNRNRFTQQQQHPIVEQQQFMPSHIVQQFQKFNTQPQQQQQNNQGKIPYHPQQTNQFGPADVNLHPAYNDNNQPQQQVVSNEKFPISNSDQMVSFSGPKPSSASIVNQPTLNHSGKPISNPQVTGGNQKQQTTNQHQSPSIQQQQQQQGNFAFPPSNMNERQRYQYNTADNAHNVPQFNQQKNQQQQPQKQGHFPYSGQPLSFGISDVNIQKQINNNKLDSQPIIQNKPPFVGSTNQPVVRPSQQQQQDQRFVVNGGVRNGSGQAESNVDQKSVVRQNAVSRAPQQLANADQQYDNSMKQQQQIPSSSGPEVSDLSVQSMANQPVKGIVANQQAGLQQQQQQLLSTQKMNDPNRRNNANNNARPQLSQSTVAKNGGGTKTASNSNDASFSSSLFPNLSPSSSNLNVLISGGPYIDLQRVESSSMDGSRRQVAAASGQPEASGRPVGGGDNTAPVSHTSQVNTNSITQQQQHTRQSPVALLTTPTYDLNNSGGEQTHSSAGQLQCPSSCLAPFVSFNCVRPNYIDESLSCPTPGSLCCMKATLGSTSSPISPLLNTKNTDNILSQQSTPSQSAQPMVHIVDSNKLDSSSAISDPDDQLDDAGGKQQQQTGETLSTSIDTSSDTAVVPINSESEHSSPGFGKNRFQATSCGLPGPSRRRTSGQAKGRVMGGFDSKPGYWCWQAALMNNKNEYLCGGALIGTKWVLTAAHCVTQHLRSESQLFVRLGQHNLNNTQGSRHAKTIQVKTSYVHHNHNGVTLDNDIALLRLEEPVDLEESSICLVCLPERSSQMEAGKRCTVTGYGFENENGPAALRVRQTDLPIVTDQECQNKTSEVLGKPFTLPASSFCAGGEIGQDACHGDGGSPLSCLVDGYYELTGIVSWGYKCGSKDLPGLYSKVSTFVGWINQIVSVNN